MKRVRDELPIACVCCDIRKPTVRVNGVWCCGLCLSIGAYRKVVTHKLHVVSR